MSPSGPSPRWGSRAPSGWYLGRLGGTPLFLAPSWIIIAVVLGVIFYPTVAIVAPGLGPVALVAAVAVVPLMLVVSVLAHEVAHGVTGRAVGAPPAEYVLTLWGGHTQFSRELRSPGASALVSVAGPAANAVLALAAWWLLGVLDPAPLGSLLLQAATLSNAVVAVFNLLPGLPLDGGRVLEALVWKVTGDRLRGTIAAGWGGRAVVVGLVVVFVLRPLLAGTSPTLTTVIWVALLGAYLWSAAGQTIVTARALRHAAGLDLRTLADPALTVRADEPLAALDALLAGRTEVPVLLVDADGRVSALVDPAAAGRVPAAARSTTPLTAVATAVPPEAVLTTLVGPRAAGAAAHAARSSRVVVLLDGERRTVSVLPVARLERALAGRAPRRAP
ncbi:site-2 protease family protein [Georgenia wangjunii]|uniref:site-2 protease family protein n=1 Tax=Georgenia wangjunii TaxID=3117730 RepID=UPI002F2673A4